MWNLWFDPKTDRLLANFHISFTGTSLFFAFLDMAERRKV
jgi:hypothetical protein